MDPTEVAAYCMPVHDLRVSCVGWTGHARLLQSVCVTGGGCEVMTVYRDTEEFRADASSSNRRVVLTSPEGWLVFVYPAQDVETLARRTFVIPGPE